LGFIEYQIVTFAFIVVHPFPAVERFVTTHHLALLGLIDFARYRPVHNFFALHLSDKSQDHAGEFPHRSVINDFFDAVEGNAVVLHLFH